MKLKLKNIGMLKEAEVTLNRLSVIAGENDNGKSTIGKIVFCIVKALNKHKEELNASKEHEVQEFFEDFYFTLRTRLNYEIDSKATYIVLKQMELLLRGDVNAETSMQLFDDTRQILLQHNVLSVSDLSFIDEFKQKLIKIVEEPEDQRRVLERAFTKTFVSEFDSQVLFRGADEGCIQVWDDSLKLLELFVDKANKVRIYDDAKPILIRDATFIETPLLLNFFSLLIRSQTQLDNRVSRRRGVPYTTLHTKDLFDKLIEPPAEFQNLVLLELINSVIDGEVSYSRADGDFVYQKEGKRISIKNTASGIKVFGILQILVANEFIDKNTLVIFDEPENHLHPKWQLKLAEILVELANSGVYIIVSSHSPYMIEALERYSKIKGLKDETSFYLAKHNEVENKNQLPEIFALLSEPFEQFRELDKQVLKDEE
ncbi:MAG: ATP-binding protein [Porphyromonadaceae bacterium]|jgi:predicted ATPase|nr:ATP-binding protein [Porphyromonadaceae bacterium]